MGHTQGRRITKHETTDQQITDYKQAENTTMNKECPNSINYFAPPTVSHCLVSLVPRPPPSHEGKKGLVTFSRLLGLH